MKAKLVPKITWKILKFDDPTGEIERISKSGLMTPEKLAEIYKDKLQGKEQFEGNVILDEGANALWTLVCGGTATHFGSANAYIGVGDGTTAESNTHTGLQGVNIQYVAVDSVSFGSDRKATWQATFGGTLANFAWEEITVANGADNTATNLNRKVQSMGTKSAGATWIAILEITIP